MRPLRLQGLVAAPHTPFTTDGALDLKPVETQAALLVEGEVRTVFVAGSTGEYASLSFEERDDLTWRWCETARVAEMRVIVHVGGNQLREAKELARRAVIHGADAVAMLAPSYFKPQSVSELVDCCADVAAAARELPFYYYDVPELTGVHLATDKLILEARERIPSFAGVKYTNPDPALFQRCLAAAGDGEDAPEVLYGQDESLLAGLSLGARAAVGSTYNFAAGLYVRLWRAFEAGNLEAARVEQRRSVQLVDVLSRYGYMAAAKQVMAYLGVDCGSVRSPLRNLEEGERDSLRNDLESVGFFEWRSAASS